MGRQALIAVLCCLSFSESLGEVDKSSKSSVAKDNVSEESAPRLYRNVPVGVYASAVPYPAVTYKFPAFASGLLPAASRIIPVKEQLVFHNANGYLRDSYGNRFVSSPQSGAYKAAIPQQFVQLQALPAHLLKPFSVAAPSYQIKHVNPQITFGSQYRIPSQTAAPTPLNHFAGGSHPVVYAQNIRSLAPSAVQFQQLQAPQQQSTSNQAVYADKHSAEKYSNYNSEPKFQRLEEAPSSTYSNAPEEKNKKIEQEIVHEQSQIKASPDTQTYTTIVNGKKTVIELDTNPPVPLLDLTLLEPLQFDNPSPVVPQIAQFLPKINQATYRKLPEFHTQQKNNKENKIQGDVEIIKGRPKGKPKKKPKKPVVYDDDTIHTKVPVEPTIIVEGKPNEGPEFSYEINAPNYKETYKEQSVKYNKETNMAPVSYSYNHKEEKDPVSYSYGNIVQKEPVHYSYVHNSKDPGHTKTEQHHINEQPKHLIYTFKPEDHRNHEEQNDGAVHPHAPQRESAESSSAEESDDDRRPHPHAGYHEKPRESSRNHEHHEYHEKPRESPRNREHHEYHEKPRESPRNHEHHEYHEKPRESPRNHEHHEYHEKPRESPRNHEHHEYHERPAHHEEQSQRPYGEHHSERHTHNANHEDRPHHIEHAPHRQDRPPQSHQPITVPVQHEQEIRPITYEYEEDIKLLPSPSPAAIQAEINKHAQKEEQHHNTHPSPHPHIAHNNDEFAGRQRHPYHPQHQISYGPAPLPVVHEKSKRIIIQEESPDELHSHSEQMVAEMLEQEENNEEDFENAYKNAAFGFPAYHRKPEDIEKNIYSPDTYGESRGHSFSLDGRPFEQYTAEGDGFPKSARLTYKDMSENNKEDYYLDYAVSKPTSLKDRYQKKKEYYKLYDSSKPDKYFGQEKKEKENEKYSVAPTFVYATDTEPKKTSYFAQYKAAPPKFTYSFKKPTTRDNSAFASRPYQSYTRKTSFVEPQFQYGFEPIAVPRLLDSELAAMASNNSPESEKPGLRKKIYKENWYIKKTSTAGGDAS